MPSSNVSGGGAESSAYLPEVNPLIKCPICLDEIEDRTTALDCQHDFCHSCISHWIAQRNRCPLCRAVIGRIRHKVTPEKGGIPVDHFEEVPVPEEQQGFIINLGFITVVRTPMDSPLHLIQPIPCPRSLRIRYAIRRLDADHTYFLAGVEQGTLWVLPEDLNNVRDVLESRGITAIEAGTHQEVGPNARHSTFLDLHDNHHARGAEASNGADRRFASPPQGPEPDDVD